ncbi:MAG TPA: TonB-dependent receptor plug domain-containing protein [Pyrinomonadaceae bacterium]|nr:TonB-dependent receptor plug domain-containing protein [Pyrinomonadaceae bacterium]
MQQAASNNSCNGSKRVRSHPVWGAHALPNRGYPAIIAVIVCSFTGAQAQEPTPTPTPGTAFQPVATTFEVIVTGSNIPTAEEVGPQPVDTYRRVDIERLGIRNATDFVQKLAMATGASINENVNIIGDGRTEIDLRGLFSKETLVLQDGRRLAPDGFAGHNADLDFFFGGRVDLNVFPLGLIDHIDILKDGASAIYGSDAVAGVFNVWLIHKFRGLEIYASYGNTNLGASNDQGEERAYLLAGTGDDKTDIVVYAEVYNRAAIYNRDRDISSNADFTRFGGDDGRSGDFPGRVGDFVYQPSLNRGAGSPARHAFPNVENDPEYVLLSSLPRTQQLFNFNALTPAMAPVDREYLYGSLDHKICQQYLELFGDFKYVRSFWDGALPPAPLTDNLPTVTSAPDVFTDATHPFGITTAGTGISVPIQNPFNPFTVADYTSPGGADRNVPGSQISAVPPGTQLTTGVRFRAGLHSNKITTNNYEFTGGLKGNLAEFGDYFKTWNWENGFRYTEDRRTGLEGEIVDNNALRAALLDTNPATAFNPFSVKQNSPAVLHKIFVTTHRLGTASLMLEDLKLYGDLWNLPAGPIAFAIGGEHRTEHENDQPDSLTASGQTIGQGQTSFLPTRGSRDVWSVYWEVRVPVTNAVWHCPGLYSLELGYQERYDNYSDFGSTEKPKFFFRWQPFDSSLTLRGTYNEAYHAPTLAELFTSQVHKTELVIDPARVLPGDPLGRTPGTPLTPPGTTSKETIGGNPNLNAEVAYEWTYGIVWTPAKVIKGLTLTADFYHIDLRNVLIASDPAFMVDLNFASSKGTLPNGAPTGGLWSDLIHRDPVTGEILSVTAIEQQNAARIWTEGLDYEALYQLDTSILGHGDFGRFTFIVNGNYLARYVWQDTPALPKLNFDNQFVGARRGSFPRNRWYTSVFYDGPAGSSLGGLDVGLIVHYIGQYWDSFFEDRKIREWTTLDLIVNYTFNLPASAQDEVAGHARSGGKNAEMTDGKGKNVAPISTAAYNPCGWRSWLNNTTITLGMNNVFDQDPPFVAGAFENGYDEWTANIRGRIWYVALKKQF